MKAVHATHLLALFPILALLTSPVSFAQEAVPVSAEPQHHLVFENAYLRVIDARLPPGYVSLYHVHARDNVPVAIHGGPIEVQMLGQEPNRVEGMSGSVSFARGGYTHRVSNLGAEEVRYIDAEIVASPTTKTAEGGEADLLPDHALELENDRVRVYRLILAPGQSRSAHEHAGAVLEVVLRGDEIRRAGAKTAAAPGTFHWCEDGALPATANGDGGPFEVVEIEWR